MKRRLTAVLLMLAMLTGLFPMQALAEDNTATSAQSIFLSQSQVQMQVGQQITLTAEISPENAAATAVWVSQDESIAAVENGVITAVASGNTTVSLEVGSLKALCSVTVVSKLRNSSQDDKITVFFSILGDSKHGNNGETHTLANGNLTVWLKQSAYTVSAQATVKDVFLAAVEGKEYSYEIPGGDYLATVNELSEFSNGPRSGWKYLLNGSYPNESIAAQQVRQGDAIVLHYTDDYTKDDNKKIGTDAIETVIQQISFLEEVTIANETAILAARKAYNALSPGQKLAVGNFILLTGAEVTLTEALIDQIPAEITLDSEDGIAHALSAYNQLSDEQKKLVENQEKLTAAKEKLDELKAPAERVIEKIEELPEEIAFEDEEAIAAARAAYDLLTEEQKELVTNYKVLTDAEDSLDHLKAAAVDDYIDAIPSETERDFEQAILNARTAYDSLTEKQKALVENYEELTAAEERLNVLKAGAVIALIDAIPEEISLDHEQIIAQARTAYDSLTDVQKNLVTNSNKLVTAERKLEILKLPATEKLYQQTGDYLAAKATPSVGSVNGEWRVIGLERSGRKVTDGYYKNVVEYVLAHINEKERLDAAKSTENSRVILALTAMGYDATNVAGHNLLVGLNEMSYIQTQGINGPIWALIALDSHDYEPTGDVTRNKLISSILAAQLGDGGWALSGNTSEPDVTAMAIQALASCYRTHSDVENAVERALNYLSEVQSPDGGYGIGVGATCESAAQVVVALTALGIDPDTDSHFVKNGVSVLDAMCAYAVDGGGFKHISGGKIDDMATEQGYYALTAYFRMKAGNTSLYDMSDVQISQIHYSIIAGADGTWNTDVQTHSIVSDGVFAEFTGVKVDGTLIGSSNYTAKAGSTYVTFENSYLKTLTLGRHSITLVFESCEVTTSLTVTKSDAELVRDVEALIDAIGTVTKSSKAKIDKARNAYNALTAKQQKLVTNYNKLTAAEKAYADLADKITVYFTLLGDTAHGDNGQEHTLAGGNLTTWISRAAYTLESPATVLDLFTKAVSGKYSYVNKGNYISSVNGLAEFTNGKNSGWMYTLNGRHPNLGVAEQKLSNGDSVVFHYTDNYTKERGSGTTGNQTTGKTTNRFLTALAEDQSYANVYQTTGDYLEALGTSEVGTIGGEWMVIGLARSGRKVPEGYYDSVIKYVTENIDANERLHSNKSTDNARLILALTAIEKDVTDVAGHNLLLGLNDMHYLQKQGINGPIWALIALDSGNYPAPTGGDVSREALIQVILDAQLGDGGWALSGENADPDMTGMALQALAPYYDRNTSVQAAVDHAVTLLSEIQDSDGCYSGVDGASCESLAQVVVALTALDIDPDTDTRFIKNGVSVLDALLQYAVSDGGFRHVLTGERDGMATEQGYYALTAYNRFLSDKTSLYDMTDIIDVGGDPVKISEEMTVSVTTDPFEEKSVKIGGFPWLVKAFVLIIASGAVVLTIAVVISKLRKKD